MKPLTLHSKADWQNLLEGHVIDMANNIARMKAAGITANIKVEVTFKMPNYPAGDTLVMTAEAHENTMTTRSGWSEREQPSVTSSEPTPDRKAESEW